MMKGGGGEKVEPGRVGARRSRGLARGLVGVERAIRARAQDAASPTSRESRRHPLGQPLDMGRGVAPDAQPRAGQRGLDQRGDGTLAFGARDMDRAE